MVNECRVRPTAAVRDRSPRVHGDVMDCRLNVGAEVERDEHSLVVSVGHTHLQLRPQVPTEPPSSNDNVPKAKIATDDLGS